MAIRDVNLDTRQTHIWVSGYQALYPRNDLFPDDDLFPSDRGVYLSNNIVAGTMKLDEIIVDGEQIIFGNLYSNKFEVQIYGEIVVDGETVNVGDYDFSNQFIYVFQEDDGVYKQIFTGKVDSCKRNRDGYDKQIVAYDSAYLYNNQNIAPWWEDFWDAKGAGATATLGELRLSLLEYVGVRYSRVVLPNDSISIKKTVDLSSFSFGSCLRMMCEINCCFPHFSRDNILEFVVLDEEVNAKNIENLYEAPSTTFEEFETQPITGIQFLNPDGELKYRVGTDANVYTVNGDNILLLDCDTAQLIAIGTNMLSYVSDLSYRPATIKMVVGDLSYNLGDRLVTSQGTHYILQNSYSGPQFVEQEIRCDGQETIKEAGRTLDTTTLVLNQRIAKVVFDVEHFETEFAEYKEETDGTLTEMSSKITQTADAITAEVHRSGTDWDTSNVTIHYYGTTDPEDGNTKASGYPASGNNNKVYLNKSNGKLYKSNNTTWVYQSTLSSLQSSVSSVQQYAESITLSVTNNTDSSTIKLMAGQTQISSQTVKFTGNVIFASNLTDGTTTISGNNIKTGSISYDTNNYWNLTNGNYRLGDSSEYILHTSSEFKIVSTGPDNSWNLKTGRFCVQTGSHYIYLSAASPAAGQAATFKIYADTNNYWDLISGAFKTTNGTFTGTITGSSITSESSGIKIVLENGKLAFYTGTSLRGYINSTSDGIVIGNSNQTDYIVNVESTTINMGPSFVDAYDAGILAKRYNGITLICGSGGLTVNDGSGASSGYTGDIVVDGKTLYFKCGIFTGFSG